LKPKVASKQWIKTERKNSVGTNGLNSVSNNATANPTAWNGQGPSATPIPSPGGNK